MATREERRRRVFAHVRVSAPATARGNATRWAQAREICSDYSSRVREADGGLTLDLTGTERLLGEPRAVGRELRNRLRTEARLETAVGLGPSATVARLASHVAAQGQVLEISASEAGRFLGRLPVETLPGVDGEWARWLGQMGIRGAGDLAALSEETVTRTLGTRGVVAWRAARGEDAEEAEAPRVTPPTTADSVAGAVDFFPAAKERTEVRAALRGAAEETARQLRAQGRATRQVSLEIVFRDLRRAEVRRTLMLPTASARTIFAVASLLFDRTRVTGPQVRRVRVRVARLVLDARGGQLALPMAEGKAAPRGSQRRTRMNADTRG